MPNDSLTLNESYTNEYLDLIAKLNGDELGKRAAWEYMKSSTAVFNGITVYSSYLPRLFDRTTQERFGAIAETTYSILAKVMDAYYNDPGYRDIFAFDERLVELMLIPRNYDAILPFARVDLFFDEDTLEAKFCEFNADGSSGMNENREVTYSIEESEPYKEFARKHNVRTMNAPLFEGWVEEFLAIYDTYTNKVENPHVVIVDYLENSVTEEFKIYAKLFEDRGIRFSVYDIRDLAFDGQHLTGTKAFLGDINTPINAIMRRFVSSDVIDHWEESQALVESVRAQSIALIGSFLGHIVHDKQLFHALFHEKTRALLTTEENTFVEQTVPFTAFLSDSHLDLADVKAHPAKWIVKPTDGYGSRDVHAGKDYDNTAWGELIDALFAEGKADYFLAQHFCTPFKTPAIPFYNNEEDYHAEAQPFNNLSGLYLINGRFSGVFSRQGPRSIILGRNGGVTAASLWVD